MKFRHSIALYCTNRYRGLLAAILSLAAIVGCGSGQESVYEVQGKVLYQGQPVPLAFVMFHPIGGSEGVQKLRPKGATDVEGKFKLTTYEPDDGAPVGEYKVTIVWRGPDPGANPDEVDLEELSEQPDRLSGKYDNLQKTPLTVTIESGSNELEPFNLK